MMSVLFALMSGVTIVLSRSVNGYLAKKVGPYQSTFFNYLTGFITSFIIVIMMGFPAITLNNNISMYLGGIIGVVNVLILNIIITKISPIKLTLITFVAQLLSSIILDYFLYNIFSLTKFIGCLLVMFGLVIYQVSDNKTIVILGEIESE